MRAVRRVRDRVTDPELQAQCEAFIGQEDEHGAQHRQLNVALAAHGYPVGRIERFVDWVVERAERRRSPEGFHPDDTDTAAMVERWRAELFGDDGSVEDRLAS